jgi:hypothetical protein
MNMTLTTPAHPEEGLSLAKARLEGPRACFETPLRQAQRLLSMSGSVVEREDTVRNS